MEVTLLEILDAREKRVARQKQLNREYGKPLVSFSMNIPGPVKDTPLIRRAFREGCHVLEAALPANAVLTRQIREGHTGCEGFWVVDMEPQALKSVTSAIEDTHGLGRLFDLDVLNEILDKLDREQVGGGSRNCIVCGAPGRGCASRRVHSVEQLQKAAYSILEGHFRNTDPDRIGELAVKALLDEVETTPKPGLVDRRNSGSHRDMDIHTFRRSANTLRDYFRECVRIGMETAAEQPNLTFRRLRSAGLEGERAMYAATAGVNTHKGAIFTMGVLCGAAGRLWKPEFAWDRQELFRQVSEMTREAMAEDLRRRGDTVGFRLYADHRIRGIRGEVVDGLPSVRDLGLPFFEACLAQGMDSNEAGVRTLITLLAQVTDTNMIARGGLDGAEAGRNAARDLTAREYTMEDVAHLDDDFIRHNLSPGGCADLLAAVYFLHSLTMQLYT